MSRSDKPGITIMNAKKISIASLAATLAFVATATVAMAQPGIITQDTKVRAKASTQSQVVDWAYDGQTVNVKKCGSGWCLIKFQGTAGWVKQNRVAFNSGPVYPHHGHHYNNGNVGFGVYGGPGGVSFGFGVSSY
jgi:uncharacterized protein YraI